MNLIKYSCEAGVKKNPERRLCRLGGIFRNPFLILILCLVILGSFAKMPVNALTQKDAVEEAYFIKHGHSDEIIRMIELQKSRIEPEEKKIKKNNRFVKFFKNLFYERDITMPLSDFGQDRIITVEAPKQ